MDPVARYYTAFGQGCTESNPLQQTWFVPHDVPGLIDLMGGAEEFSRQLEDFFEKTPASFGWNDYYNHANEPVGPCPLLVCLCRQTLAYAEVGSPYPYQCLSK